MNAFLLSSNPLSKGVYDNIDRLVERQVLAPRLGGVGGRNDFDHLISQLFVFDGYDDLFDFVAHALLQVFDDFFVSYILLCLLHLKDVHALLQVFKLGIALFAKA